MIERCHRICGGLDDCFINNRKQIECLSDILINKAFGTVQILENLLRESNDTRLKSSIREALRGPYEIINWIKYIQIAHDIKFSPIPKETDLKEKRKEIRYPLPEFFQQYINLYIDAEGLMLNGQITNISQQGLQFITPKPLKTGMICNLKITSTRTANKNLFLKVRITYSLQKEESYISGASIIELYDDSSFNFFKYVIDLLYYSKLTSP